MRGIQLKHTLLLRSLSGREILSRGILSVRKKGQTERRAPAKERKKKKSVSGHHHHDLLCTQKLQGVPRVRSSFSV